MRPVIKIFDLDNTLIRTSARVKLEHGNPLPAKLYNDLESRGLVSRAGTEGIDYSEFNDIQRLISDPHLPAWNLLRDGDHIITGRADREVLEKFFSFFGLNPILHCCGGRDSVASQKCSHLRSILEETRPLEVFIFEDNPVYGNAMCGVLTHQHIPFYWYMPTGNKFTLQSHA